MNWFDFNNNNAYFNVARGFYLHCWDITIKGQTRKFRRLGHELVYILYYNPEYDSEIKIKHQVVKIITHKLGELMSSLKMKTEKFVNNLNELSADLD